MAGTHGLVLRGEGEAAPGADLPVCDRRLAEWPPRQPGDPPQDQPHGLRPWGGGPPPRGARASGRFRALLGAGALRGPWGHCVPRRSASLDRLFREQGF